jgi:hypothetical protein
MKNYYLFYPLLLASLLASCQPTNTPVSSNSNHSEDSKAGYQSVSWNASDEISGSITLGDPFTDTDMGYALSAGKAYPLNFSFSDDDTSKATATSSNSNVLKLEKASDTGKYTATGVAPGETILTIQDSTGWTRYRNKIKVLNPVSLAEVDDFLANKVEYYVCSDPFAKTSTLKITFLGGNTASMSGTFEGSTLPKDATFTYAHDSKLDWDNDYGFAISSFSAASTSFNPKSFILRHTGDVMHVYDNAGYYLTMLDAVMVDQ